MTVSLQKTILRATSPPSRQIFLTLFLNQKGKYGGAASEIRKAGCASVELVLSAGISSPSQQTMAILPIKNQRYLTEQNSVTRASSTRRSRRRLRPAKRRGEFSAGNMGQAFKFMKHSSQKAPAPAAVRTASDAGDFFANALSLRLCRCNLAAPARFERATYCLGGSRSIHLGYGVVSKSGFIITQALQSRKK